MTITHKRQVLALSLLVILILVLPAAVFLARRQQDIRPKASQAKANLLLKTDTSDIDAGETSTVVAYAQITDSNVKISGTDFTILYEGNKLEVEDISPSDSFTDVQVKSWGGKFLDTDLSYLRVAQTANKPKNQLPSGTFTLATIKFKGIGDGGAIVKYPDENQYLEIVAASSQP